MSSAPSPERESLVLVSGFGAFEEVESNPSGEIARALAAAPPPGLCVRAAVLPVSFARAPRVWDEELGGLAGARLGPSAFPCLFLGLGVAKEAGFRLERWGRPELKLVPRSDVDGRTAAEFSRPGPGLETGLDLARLLERLRARGVTDARVSDTAGGYVCEHVYHHLLARAAERGALALFVHVPPLRLVPLARQVQVVRGVLEELRDELHPEPRTRPRAE